MSGLRKPSELRLAASQLRPYLVRASWFSLATSLLLLMPTWYMLSVYERVVNSRSHMTLAMVTLLVVGAYVLMEVLVWVRSDLMFQSGLDLDRALSERVFVALFEANLRKLPAMTSMALGDLRAIREFLSSSALLVVMEAPVSLVFLVAIFAISPVLGWAAAIAALFQVALGWLNERSIQPAMAHASQAAYGANQYAEDMLRNTQVIESMGMVGNIHRLWISKQRDFLRHQAIGSIRAGGFQALSKMTQTVVGSVLLGLSAWLLLHSKLNGGPGMLIAAGVLGGRLLTPLVQMVAQWRSIVGVRDSWTRLDALLTALPPKPSNMPLPPPKGNLRVEEVIATAPTGGVAILKGISFDLAPGEVLAVVGASAAGKTTLARLLMGIWPANSGKVRLDGVDVYSWNKAELGPHVGYLPQNIELFNGTVSENIARFGEPDPDKVRAAATALGLHDYIMTMPLGYGSQVGTDGAILSGGFRQRVGLARAIYGEPAFVVLDEPNSSLDEAGDLALTNTIASMKVRGTTFVINTHRTSVFSVSDKLLVLHEGRVQAYGPLGEVLAALKGENGSPQASAQPLPAIGAK
jgi:ATP-binding cassette subfamily C exporter for protease/lipase